MSVEIQWQDVNEHDGEKRFVRVDRFAGRWRFQIRARRREDWQDTTPDGSMLETLLEALDRRCQRGDGVDEEDVNQIRRQIERMRGH